MNTANDPTILVPHWRRQLFVFQEIVESGRLYRANDNSREWLKPLPPEQAAQLGWVSDLFDTFKVAER